MRCALLLVLALGGFAAQAQPFFDAPWRAFDTGTWENGRYATALATADFNGDGLPDAVLGQRGFSTGIRVLLNIGDGTYGPPTPYPTTYRAWDVVAADLDGDGDVDVAATNSDESHGTGSLVAVFYNTGTGAFAAPTYFAAGPTGPNGITAADFDGDGDMDLAVANYGWFGSSASVSVLINAGASLFSAPAVYAVPPTAYRVEAGDLNGDGRPDLVVAHDEYAVSVLMNNGTGAFGPAAVYDELGYAWTQPYYGDVALGDVEGDGDIDVFYSNIRLYTASSIDPHFILLRNSGSGALQAPVQVFYQSPYENIAAEIDVADLNGDGRPDFFGAQGYEAGFMVMMNNGSGGYLPSRQYAAGGSGVAIAAADIDADGDRDVVTANGISRLLTTHVNPGNGHFPELPIHGRHYGLGVLDVGDVDGDGDMDVAASSFVSTTVSVHVNGGGALNQSYTTPGGQYAFGKLRDLNGDGNLDLLFVSGSTNPPYDFFTAWGNGDGTFGPIVRHQLGTCGLAHPGAFDLDADGDLDVVNTERLGCPGVPLSGRRLFISRNNGDGTFQQADVVLASIHPYNVAAGDFNEDGNLDLLTVGTTSAVMLGNGDGSFLPEQPFPLGYAAGNALVLDLDSDGHLDVATLAIDDNDESHLAVALGNGAAGFATSLVAPSLQLFGGWVTSGDVDGDADVDLVTSGVQDAAVFLNNASGAFTYHGRYGLGKNGSAPQYVDATGDQVGDIVAIATHAWPPAGTERGLIIVEGLTGIATAGPAGPPAAANALSAPAPNPFDATTRFTLTLSRAQSVTVAAFDVLGRRVATLHDGRLADATVHTFILNGTRLPAGVYVVRAEGEAFSTSQRVTLAR